jgi:hypothetical protein
MRYLTGLARLGLPLFILCSAAPAVAHELSLDLNDSAFRVTYVAPLRDAVRLDAGWLRDGDEGDVVHAGFQVTGDAAPAGQKVTAGVGVRLALLDGEGSGREGYALGIGGSLRWVIPAYDRFVVSGEYYWAPDLLSGGDAEEYFDGTVRVGYSVTRQAEVYVGARYTGANYEDRPCILFDTGLHAGFDLRF